MKTCPFCDQPSDADGGIFHVGGCEGLQKSGLNKLQERILTDERDAALLKLDAAEKKAAQYAEYFAEPSLTYIKELESRLDSLVKFAREYADHTPSCNDHHGACICGFDAKKSVVVENQNS